jgi:alginate O-acetyltransferase complex protein AlgI
MVPLLDAVRIRLAAHPVEWYFDRGLWIMGAAHFLVLVASFQVPSKLNWKEELPRLSPFNRKLMYAYGAFIVLTIVTFGVFTLTMHGELLRGSAPALFFAGFVSIFWMLRIGLDAFYYRHEDWPRGAQFVIGHALLTSLFAFLTLSYGGLLVWKLVS